jgi:large-conductance mechanosensitive channel
MESIVHQTQKVENVVSGTYKKFFYDFQQFMFANNVLVASTGFCVGMATKEVIEKLMNLAVLPLIHFFTKFSIIRILYKKLIENAHYPFLKSLLEIFGEVVWSILVWIVIIVMTFITLEYILNRNVIGLTSTIKTENKLDFAKSKAEAKENIIPTLKEAKNIIKVDNLEKKTGEVVKKLEDAKLEDISKKSLEQFYNPSLLST